MIETARRVAFHGGSRQSAASSGLGTLLAAVALVAIVLGGCAKALPIHYYQISYPYTAVASDNAIDVSIVFRNFVASHLYREDRIVYGSTSEQMGTYLEERWAEAPTDMLQNSLVRGIRSSGKFRGVGTLRSSSQPDFLISGHLYEFRELDSNGVQASLNFDLEMREVRTERIVWTYTYNHAEPVSGAGVPAVAAAMNKNVQQSVRDVQASLEDYFHKNPPAVPAAKGS